MLFDFVDFSACAVIGYNQNIAGNYAVCLIVRDGSDSVVAKNNIQVLMILSRI